METEKNGGGQGLERGGNSSSSYKMSNCYGLTNSMVTIANTTLSCT